MSILTVNQVLFNQSIFANKCFNYNLAAHIPSNDKDLMPPPSLPLKSQMRYVLVQMWDVEWNKKFLHSACFFTSQDSARSDSCDEDKSDTKFHDKKLDTPLAAMLPSKYANVDVRELFPDFRPDKVLRFSRLFGPGKPSSLPQIWRSVRKRRHRRKQSRDGTIRVNCFINFISMNFLQIL